MGLQASNGRRKHNRVPNAVKGRKNEMKINGIEITNLKKTVREFNLINSCGLYSDIWLDLQTGKLSYTEEADTNTYHVSDEPDRYVVLVNHRWFGHITMGEVKSLAFERIVRYRDDHNGRHDRPYQITYVRAGQQFPAESQILGNYKHLEDALLIAQAHADRKMLREGWYRGGDTILVCSVGHRHAEFRVARKEDDYR